MIILLKKSVCVGLSLCYFTTQGALGSAAESNVWAERKKTVRSPQLARLSGVNSSTLFNQLPTVMPALPSIPKWSETNVAKNLKLSPALRRTVDSVPLAYATVQDIHESGDEQNPPVVLVQDVHMNAEAQTNIAHVLLELIDRKTVGLIGVEGAFEEFDFKPFREFPDKKIAHEVTQAFLDKSLLAAPSYVGITSPQEPPLFLGVDDRSHYDVNVRAYLDSRPIKERLVKELGQREAGLLEDKKKTFTPALLEFDGYRSAYNKGDMGLGMYVRKLSNMSRHSGMSLSGIHRGNSHADSDDPGLRHAGMTASEAVSLVVDQFLSAYDLETSLDFKRVEFERKTVIEKLSASMNEQETSALLAQSLAYRMGRLSYGAYYQNLKTLCAEKGISLRQTPAFDDYIQYVLLSDGIKASELFASVKELEEKILQTLAVTNEERHLVAQSEHLMLTRKLIDFSLAPEEWTRYQEFKCRHPGESRGPGLKHVFKEKFKDWIPASAGMTTAPFESFYEQADLRSQKMVDNLLRALRAPRALVTGGFHTPAIARFLRERNISYVVVSPKITKIDTATGSEYLSVFAREKTSLDKLFEGKKLFLSDRSAQISHGPTAFRILAICWAQYTHAAKVSFELGKKLYSAHVDIMDRADPTKAVVKLTPKEWIYAMFASSVLSNWENLVFLPLFILRQSLQTNEWTVGLAWALYLTGAIVFGWAPHRRRSTAEKFWLTIVGLAIGASFMGRMSSSGSWIASGLTHGAYNLALLLRRLGERSKGSLPLATFVADADGNKQFLRKIDDIQNQLLSPQPFQSGRRKGLISVNGLYLNFGDDIADLVLFCPPQGKKGVRAKKASVLIDRNNPDNRLYLIPSAEKTVVYHPPTTSWHEINPPIGHRSISVADMNSISAIQYFKDTALVQYYSQKPVQVNIINANQAPSKAAYLEEISFSSVKLKIPKVDKEPHIQAPVKVNRINQTRNQRNVYVVLVDPDDNANYLFFLSTPLKVYLFNTQGFIHDYSKTGNRDSSADRDMYIDTFIQDLMNKQNKWDKKILGPSSESKSGNFEIGSSKGSGAQFVLPRNQDAAVEKPGQVSTFGWAPVARLLNGTQQVVSEIYRVAPNEFVISGIGDIKNENAPICVLSGNHFYLPDVLEVIGNRVPIDNQFRTLVGTRSEPASVRGRRYRWNDSHTEIAVFLDGKPSRRRVVYVYSKQINPTNHDDRPMNLKNTSVAAGVVLGVSLGFSFFTGDQLTSMPALLWWVGWQVAVYLFVVSIVILATRSVGSRLIPTSIVPQGPPKLYGKPAVLDREISFTQYDANNKQYVLTPLLFFLLFADIKPSWLKGLARTLGYLLLIVTLDILHLFIHATPWLQIEKDSKEKAFANEAVAFMLAQIIPAAVLIMIVIGHVAIASVILVDTAAFIGICRWVVRMNRKIHSAADSATGKGGKGSSLVASRLDPLPPLPVPLLARTLNISTMILPIVATILGSAVPTSSRGTRMFLGLGGFALGTCLLFWVRVIQHKANGKKGFPSFHDLSADLLINGPFLLSVLYGISPNEFVSMEHGFFKTELLKENWNWITALHFCTGISLMGIGLGMTRAWHGFQNTRKGMLEQGHPYYFNLSPSSARFWLLTLPVLDAALKFTGIHFPAVAVFHAGTISPTISLACYLIWIALAAATFHIRVPLGVVLLVSGLMVNVTEMRLWHGAIDPLFVLNDRPNLADLLAYTGVGLSVADIFHFLSSRDLKLRINFRVNQSGAALRSVIMGLCLLIPSSGVMMWSIFGPRSAPPGISIVEGRRYALVFKRDPAKLVHDRQEFKAYVEWAIRLYAFQDPDVLKTVHSGAEWEELVTKYPHKTLSVLNEFLNEFPRPTFTPTQSGHSMSFENFKDGNYRVAIVLLKEMVVAYLDIRNLNDLNHVPPGEGLSRINISAVGQTPFLKRKAQAGVLQRWADHPEVRADDVSKGFTVDKALLQQHTTDPFWRTPIQEWLDAHRDEVKKHLGETTPKEYTSEPDQPEKDFPPGGTLYALWKWVFSKDLFFFKKMSWTEYREKAWKIENSIFLVLGTIAFIATFDLNGQPFPALLHSFWWATVITWGAFFLAHMIDLVLFGWRNVNGRGPPVTWRNLVAASVIAAVSVSPALLHLVSSYSSLPSQIFLLTLYLLAIAFSFHMHGAVNRYSQKLSINTFLNREFPERGKPIGTLYELAERASIRSSEPTLEEKVLKPALIKFGQALEIRALSLRNETELGETLLAQCLPAFKHWSKSSPVSDVMHRDNDGPCFAITDMNSASPQTRFLLFVVPAAREKIRARQFLERAIQEPSEIVTENDARNLIKRIVTYREFLNAASLAIETPIDKDLDNDARHEKIFSQIQDILINEKTSPQQPASLSWNSSRREKDSAIQQCADFPSLYRVIRLIGGVQGSSELFMAYDIWAMIERFRNDPRDPLGPKARHIPRDLRGKVTNLLINEAATWDELQNVFHFLETILLGDGQKISAIDALKIIAGLIRSGQNPQEFFSSFVLCEKIIWLRKKDSDSKSGNRSDDETRQDESDTFPNSINLQNASAAAVISLVPAAVLYFGQVFGISPDVVNQASGVAGVLAMTFLIALVFFLSNIIYNWMSKYFSFMGKTGPPEPFKLFGFEFASRDTTHLIEFHHETADNPKGFDLNPALFRVLTSPLLAAIAVLVYAALVTLAFSLWLSPSLTPILCVAVLYAPISIVIHESVHAFGILQASSDNRAGRVWNEFVAYGLGQVTPTILILSLLQGHIVVAGTILIALLAAILSFFVHQSVNMVLHRAHVNKFLGNNIMESITPTLTRPDQLKENDRLREVFESITDVCGTLRMRAHSVESLPKMGRLILHDRKTVLNWPMDLLRPPFISFSRSKSWLAISHYDGSIWRLRNRYAVYLVRTGSERDALRALVEKAVGDPFVPLDQAEANTMIERVVTYDEFLQAIREATADPELNAFSKNTPPSKIAQSICERAIKREVKPQKSGVLGPNSGFSEKKAAIQEANSFAALCGVLNAIGGALGSEGLLTADLLWYMVKKIRSNNRKFDIRGFKGTFELRDKITDLLISESLDFEELYTAIRPIGFVQGKGSLVFDAEAIIVIIKEMDPDKNTLGNIISDTVLIEKVNELFKEGHRPGARGQRVAAAKLPLATEIVNIITRNANTRKTTQETLIDILGMILKDDSLSVLGLGETAAASSQAKIIPPQLLGELALELRDRIESRELTQAQAREAAVILAAMLSACYSETEIKLDIMLTDLPSPHTTRRYVIVEWLPSNPSDATARAHAIDRERPIRFQHCDYFLLADGNQIDIKAINDQLQTVLLFDSRAYRSVTELLREIHGDEKKPGDWAGFHHKFILRPEVMPPDDFFKVDANLREAFEVFLLLNATQALRISDSVLTNFENIRRELIQA